MQKIDYVLYHSNCYDGFGAAYAAWKILKDSAKYIPVSYGRPIPDMSEKNIGTVYILDFSYQEADLLKIKETTNCEKIVLLDHHKTAKENLANLIGKYEWLYIEFDMNRSGALITWEYFHNEPNELINHISDRDLWNFKLDGTKEIHRSLVSRPMDFESWDRFDLNELKAEGVILNRMYTQLVKNICAKPFTIKIGDFSVPAVNTSIAWSEVGNELLSMFPNCDFAASFTVFEDIIMFSLRSRNEFDVSAVAKKFGGGGHKNAAGFKINKGDLMGKYPDIRI